MRVTSGLFVAALVRRANAAGAFAVVARKGAEEAGAILIRVDKPDRTSDLYVPAPQTAYGETVDERRFVRRFPEGPVDEERIATAIRSETRIDPDVWVVAIEDRDGRHFLDDLLVG